MGEQLPDRTPQQLLALPAEERLRLPVHAQEAELPVALGDRIPQDIQQLALALARPLPSVRFIYADHTDHAIHANHANHGSMVA